MHETLWSLASFCSFELPMRCAGDVARMRQPQILKTEQIDFPGESSACWSSRVLIDLLHEVCDNED